MTYVHISGDGLTAVAVDMNFYLEQVFIFFLINKVD